MLDVPTFIINAKGTQHFMDFIPNVLTKSPYQHYTVMSFIETVHFTRETVSNAFS